MKKVIVILLFLSGTSYLSAQQTVDVVSTQNGSIYRGKIIEETDQKIKISIAGNNLIALERKIITDISSEQVTDERTVKKTGYFNFISGGVLVGSTANELRAPFTALMENAYRYNHFSVGIITGVEFLNEATVPLAFSTRGWLPLKGGATAYIGGMGGYSFSVEDAKDSQYEITGSYGGVMFLAEAGLIFPSYGNLSFFLAAGYRYNELNYTREDWYLPGNVDRKVYYNRISLRVGVLFY